MLSMCSAARKRMFHLCQNAHRQNLVHSLTQRSNSSCNMSDRSFSVILGHELSDSSALRFVFQVMRKQTVLWIATFP